MSEVSSIPVWPTHLRHVTVFKLALDSQDFNWHPYNIVASAANCALEEVAPLGGLSYSMVQAVGAAAISTIDFAAQLACINEQADQDEEACMRSRFPHKCQVRRRQH